VLVDWEIQGRYWQTGKQGKYWQKEKNRVITGRKGKIG
jgi:hypothetical protein